MASLQASTCTDAITRNNFLRFGNALGMYRMLLISLLKHSLLSPAEAWKGARLAGYQGVSDT